MLCVYIELVTDSNELLGISRTCVGVMFFHGLRKRPAAGPRVAERCCLAAVPRVMGHVRRRCCSDLGSRFIHENGDSIISQTS